MINFHDAAISLRTLAHPHRIQIVHFLTTTEKSSVGEIATLLCVENSVASEHLTLLKTHDLLSSQRDGRRVFYSLKEPSLRDFIDYVKIKFSSMTKQQGSAYE